MDLKITEQKQNPFFSRAEIKAQLLYEGKTPSIPEIRKALASQLKKEEQLVIIKNILTKFGSNNAIVEARAYNKKEDLEKAEPKYILNRQTGKKAEGKAEEKRSEQEPKEKLKEKQPEKPKEETKKPELKEKPAEEAKK